MFSVKLSLCGAAAKTLWSIPLMLGSSNLENPRLLRNDVRKYGCDGVRGVSRGNPPANELVGCGQLQVAKDRGQQRCGRSAAVRTLRRRRERPLRDVEAVRDKPRTSPQPSAARSTRAYLPHDRLAIDNRWAKRSVGALYTSLPFTNAATRRVCQAERAL